MDKKFIEQAKFLRIEYFKVVKEISSREKEVQNYKDDFDKLQEIIKNGNKDIILSTITEFEKKINKMEEDLSPHLKKIKELEKNADQLFENIKEFYPNITGEEIQNELSKHLKDINLVL